MKVTVINLFNNIYCESCSTNLDLYIKALISRWWQTHNIYFETDKVPRKHCKYPHMLIAERLVDSCERSTYLTIYDFF